MEVGRAHVMDEVRGQSAREFSLAWGRPVFFVLFRPLTDWMRCSALWAALCFTQSTNLNVNNIQKHSETLRMFDQIFWHPTAQRSRHKINHHNI